MNRSKEESQTKVGGQSSADPDDGPSRLCLDAGASAVRRELRGWAEATKTEEDRAECDYTDRNCHDDNAEETSIDSTGSGEEANSGDAVTDASGEETQVSLEKLVEETYPGKWEEFRSSDASFLDLMRCNINAEGASALADALKRNGTLVALDLYHNRIGAAGAAALADAISCNVTLVSLNLEKNGIGADGAAALADALKRNSALADLNLERNDIGPKGAVALAGGLKHNVSLATLKIAWNGIGGEGAKALADSLKYASVTYLEVGTNRIGVEGAMSMAAALRHGISLTTFDMRNNQIGYDGVKALADSLKHGANLALANLNVYGNGIAAEGATALADALMRNTTLISLNLENNCICKGGAAALADMLKRNTTLSTLNIEKNGIGDEGAAAMADALKQNSTLITLYMAANSIGPAGAGVLADAIKCNSTLTELDMSGNKINAEGAGALASGLKSNATLATLTLEGSGIRCQGAAALADALTCNSTLTNLDVAQSIIGVVGGRKLAAALKSNTTVTELDLYGNYISSESKVACDRLVQQNKVIREHSNAIAIFGIGFYITLQGDNQDATNKGRSKLLWRVDAGSMEAHIWQAAVGDGVAFKILHELLQDIFGGGCRKCRGNAGSAESAGVDMLIKACRSKAALKELVDFEAHHLLHVVATFESNEALDLCKFLVDKVGADFDRTTDNLGRSARDIATASKNSHMVQWARSVGTFLGRYRIDEGHPVYKSATCTVYFATDMQVSKIDNRNIIAAEEAGERCHVALKLISERKHFDRELNIRLVHRSDSGADVPPGLNRFNEDHVVKMYRYHDEVDERGKQVLCLVMPRADRSLDHIIRAERVAGHEIHLIRHFAVHVARALQHLHVDRDTLHADFKPRNVVRTGSNFKLIDFDTSVRLGDPVRVDKVSTGYCPPELAQVLFANEETSDELERLRDDLKSDLERRLSSSLRAMCEAELKVTEEKIEQLQARNAEPPNAHPTYDIWAFGVVMYYMLTGTGLFKCNNDDCLASADEESELVQWKGLRHNDLKYVLSRCRGATRQDIRASKDMLKRCLMPDPSDRPQSMSEVLGLPFFDTSGARHWTPGERNSISVLFSDPLVWTDDEGLCHPIDRLNLSRERELLVDCIRNSGKGIELSFDCATDARLQDLAAVRCGCVHFSCHGNPSYLLFEDGSGGSHFLAPGDLRKLLPRTEPFKFVFVSACESQAIGQAFIDAGVPHVLCVEHDSQIIDDAAAQFTRSFYGALAEGRTVRRAFKSGEGAVCVRSGEEESRKYLLLPEDGDHDISIFDADELEWNKEPDVERPLPAPPPDFFGRQVVMHKVVHTILSKKRLVTLYGESGVGRTSVASAVCHYIKDRLSTTLNVDEIFYIRRDRSASDVDGSLLHPLYQQLVAEGKAESNDRSSSGDFICEALSQVKALIAFDGVDDLEDPICSFLHQLFERTVSVIVLLTARQPTNFSSSAVVETAIRIEPLDHTSALNLFQSTCPHTNRKAGNLFTTVSKNAPKTCERPGSKSVLEALQTGFPSRIIEATQKLSGEEYLELMAL